jgi:seryl-tRNA synthetase
MVASSEAFYQGLKLPYQVINIASGALNDAAAMKYDLEAWFPGYNAFRELVSCSNCTDFQSRALETRFAERDVDEKQYVHLLNGTLCATERTMCCIMENYQTDKGVVVPEVLRPYMGGVEFLPYNEAATKRFFKQKEDDRLAEEKKAKAKGGK